MPNLAPVLWCKKSIYKAEPDAVAFAPMPRLVTLHDVDYVIVSEAEKVAQTAISKGYTVGSGVADLSADFDMAIISVDESRSLINELEIANGNATD